MKQPSFWKTGVIAGILWISVGMPALLALDLGIVQQAPDKPQKVEVVDQPIKVTPQDEGGILEITPSIPLEPNGVYESDYVDVRAYRNITVYVIPTDTSSIKIKSAAEEPPVLYQLDAFFAADIGGAVKLMTFGDDQPQWANHSGFQEFGALTVDEDGNEGRSSFTKLSTGRTHSRCLSTVVYGPYVRIVLRNFTDKEKQNYKVIAYLSH